MESQEHGGDCMRSIVVNCLKMLNTVGRKSPIYTQLSVMSNQLRGVTNHKTDLRWASVSPTPNDSNKRHIYDISIFWTWKINELNNKKTQLGAFQRGAFT
jgi:hypothetical protein